MMPVIFIGHGSPMNAIEINKFTTEWKKIAASFPKPEAVVSISAHWETEGTGVVTKVQPQIIYDFYGFPRELYEVKYNVMGAPKLALDTIELLKGFEAVANNQWGIDHGTWSVLNVMYPDADIPVYQVSIDREATPEELYEIGKSMKSLREKNVLIMGSGNIVHNLRILDFSNEDGFDWAHEFNDYIKEKILSNDMEGIFNYRKLGRIANLAVPTNEHFNPLLYVLGARLDTDKVTIYNDDYMAGSLAMTSYVFG